MPHPISTNAPNGSRCVTREVMISPGMRSSMKLRLHSICASRLDKYAVVLPPFSSIEVTLKQTGLPTRVITAMSLTSSPSWQRHTSFFGIMPVIPRRSTCRFISPSQRSAVLSIIIPFSIARSMPMRPIDKSSRFCALPIIMPSGLYVFIIIGFSSVTF